MIVAQMTFSSIRYKENTTEQKTQLRSIRFNK